MEITNLQHVYLYWSINILEKGPSIFAKNNEQKIIYVNFEVSYFTPIH